MGNVNVSHFMWRKNIMVAFMNFVIAEAIVFRDFYL
jgi:hypothetical protein